MNEIYVVVRKTQGRDLVLLQGSLEDCFYFKKNHEETNPNSDARIHRVTGFKGLIPEVGPEVVYQV